MRICNINTPACLAINLSFAIQIMRIMYLASHYRHCEREQRAWQSSPEGLRSQIVDCFGVITPRNDDMRFKQYRKDG